MIGGFLALAWPSLVVLAAFALSCRSWYRHGRREGFRLGVAYALTFFTHVADTPGPKVYEAREVDHLEKVATGEHFLR